MDIGAGTDSSDDIQTQVLQTTLAEVATLRQAAASSNEGGDDASERPDCCVICLDTISDPCAALPCAHSHFDFLCLLSWLDQRPACPLCKAGVYKVRYTDASKGESIYRVPNAPKNRNSAATSDAATRTFTDSSTRGGAFLHNSLFRDTDRRCSRRGPHRPRSPPTPDEAIQRRRYIYRHQLYSLPDVGSNRHSRYRPQPPTPTQLSSTPHLVSRARLWIRRELQVFSFLSDSDTDPSSNNNNNSRRRANAEFLLEYVVAVLKTVDLQSAGGHAESLLADFLGRDHARLFLHELRCWLRSPCGSLAAWDREVQYPDPNVRRPRSGHDHEDDDDDDDERVEREDLPGGTGPGTSWRDRSGGDHWRAAARDAHHRGRKRKGKGFEDDGGGAAAAEGNQRVNRPRRDPRRERTRTGEGRSGC
ncbi:hypothetical protein N656DRAFT_785304 [Canariomyces notabilis]|uniref:RING-type E3 ubiquitin transferase n=1 Tax=Canariomyces notabilis TaxID=2074819 RepID=A0AAN6QC01_9PEZI|nr:hypothetical protein N656DRAFT_785304 [Canariomyces arenarius]